MRILGVHLSNGLVSVENNWKSKVDKLKSVITLWSSRELSFIGRAMILNVLGASRFWLVAIIVLLGLLSGKDITQNAWTSLIIHMRQSGKFECERVFNRSE